MIWSCSSVDEEDQTKQPMSGPRGIYQVCQVLAQISRNNYTGHEQCELFFNPNPNPNPNTRRFVYTDIWIKERSLRRTSREWCWKMLARQQAERGRHIQLWKWQPCMSLIVRAMMMITVEDMVQELPVPLVSWVPVPPDTVGAINSNLLHYCRNHWLELLTSKTALDWAAL